MQMSVYDEIHAMQRPSTAELPNTLESKNTLQFEMKSQHHIIQNKNTFKNYIFINIEHSIIGIHPTNATFQHLHIGKNIPPSTPFCASKQHGIFWINSDKKTVTQSVSLNYLHQKKINLTQFCILPTHETMSSYDIIRSMCYVRPFILLHTFIFRYVVNNILYDESFGISGRLIMHCHINYRSHQKTMFIQCFKQNELSLVTSESETILCIYAMLYGDYAIKNYIEQCQLNNNSAQPHPISKRRYEF